MAIIILFFCENLSREKKKETKKKCLSKISRISNICKLKGREASIRKRIKSRKSPLPCKSPFKMLRSLPPGSQSDSLLCSILLTQTCSEKKAKHLPPRRGNYTSTLFASFSSIQRAVLFLYRRCAISTCQ